MFHHPLVIVKSTATTFAPDEALAMFTSKRTCEGAVDALQLLEAHPAHVVVLELGLDEMSGLEVAEAIRDIDSERSHYTYIVLVGDTPDSDVMEGFGSAIDAFVRLRDQPLLCATIRAGARISEQINQLNTENLRLLEEQENLRKGQLLDPLTGLGNRRMAEQALDDSIRQIESRGGAVCFLMISVENYDEVLETYDERIASELIVAVSERIHSLVRPLDIVTHYDTSVFAMVLIQPSISQCTAECYERIFEGVRLKSYKTAIGYLPAKIAMSICASHAESGAPDAATMIKTAESGLPDALSSQKIVVSHLSD